MTVYWLPPTGNTSFFEACSPRSHRAHEPQCCRCPREATDSDRSTMMSPSPLVSPSLLAFQKGDQVYVMRLGMVGGLTRIQEGMRSWSGQRERESALFKDSLARGEREREFGTLFLFEEKPKSLGGSCIRGETEHLLARISMIRTSQHVSQSDIKFFTVPSGPKAPQIQSQKA